MLGLGFLVHMTNPGNPDNLLPGGRGDKLRKKDVNKKELARGIKHELEHVNSGNPKRDRRMATEIALDHLAEHRDYYTKLERAEKKMKPTRKQQ